MATTAAIILCGRHAQVGLPVIKGLLPKYEGISTKHTGMKGVQLIGNSNPYGSQCRGRSD
jgi:hypothetical protein